jgi:hypothetical protein
MACYNWKGKAAAHFHQTFSYDIFLLIRACDIFVLVEYLAHPNSILIYDPTKFNE